MQSSSLNPILAFAPSATGGTQSPAPWYLQLFPFVLLLVVFYVALIRPQQKKAKEQANMLKSLKPGDKVVTSGGVMGVVVTVKDTTLTLRSADSKMEILKSAIATVTERAGESSDS